MNKFLFKSPETDFQKLIQLKYEILNKNILYISHRVDKIHDLLQTLQVDKRLQKQVDEYMEDSGYPAEDQEPD